MNELADGADEAENQHQEQHRESGNDRHGRGEDGVWALALVVGIAEERGLHAEGEEDEQQGGVGVEVSDNAIASALSGDAARVERHKHIIEETPDDAAEAINGGVFDQRFEICHITK